MGCCISKYEKEEILEIYLNEIYLGQKGPVAINGVGEASYFYFGKPVRELSRTEAATIAGLIKAPNHYSPYQDKKRCLSRRNFILTTMHRKGWLPKETLQADLNLKVTCRKLLDISHCVPHCDEITIIVNSVS